MRSVAWVAAIGVALEASACGASRPTPVERPVRPERSEVRLEWTDLPPRAPEDREAARAGMVAVDGTVLELRDLNVRALVQGPLAFTEVHLYFANPSERVLEAQFTFGLPAGASVSRFALRAGDDFQEAEIVARHDAEAVYSTYVGRRRDPGILTQVAPRLFQARVFPVEAHEQREIIVSYSHALPKAGEPYRFPLLGLQRLAHFKARVVVDGRAPNGTPAQAAYEVERPDFTPDHDFVLPFDSRVRPTDALRGGRFAVARVTPPVSYDEQPISSATILVDTSASRIGILHADAARVKRFAEILGAAENPTLHVLAFDQEVQPTFSGRAKDFGTADFERLVHREALGASDLGAALQSLPGRGALGPTVVVMTDCESTVGPPERQRLRNVLDDLRRRGLGRIDVVASEPYDEPCARELSRAGRHPGWVFSTPGFNDTGLVANLRHRVPGSARFAVPHSRWTYPEVVNGLEPGASVLVFAELGPSEPLDVAADFGSASEPDSTTSDGTLVTRAAVQARVEELSALQAAARGPERGKLVSEIIGLSRQYRVLSPFTALLALESAAEYARWKIDRRSVSDILTLGDWSLEHRRPSSSGSGRSSGSAAPFEVDPSNNPGVIDHDEDGIPDAVDRCPDKPGDGLTNGCPRVYITETESGLTLFEPIAFKSGSSKVLRESHPLLDELVEIMRERPDVVVEVRGHTDSRESPLRNLRLSQARADAVKKYLVAHGVQPERLLAHGLGGATPRESNDTAEGRQKNRRVEFRFAAEMAPPHIPKPGPIGAARKGVELEIERLRATSPAKALERALEEYRRVPDAISAIVVGESFEALGRMSDAARAYGSLFELSDRGPMTASAAGFWLERLARRATGPEANRASELALAAFQNAARQLRDDPGPTRAIALALARRGRAMEAYELLRPPANRYYDLRPVLALLAAAAVRADPKSEERIDMEISRYGLTRSGEPSLLIALETAHRDSGGELFVARSDRLPREYTANPDEAAIGAIGLDEHLSFIGAPATRRYEIAVQATHRRATPLFGRVQIVRHDGRGNLEVEDRPFLIQIPGVLVELGQIDGAAAPPPGQRPP